MPLTTQEKERTRYHMGYMQVQPAAAIQFGMPRPVETAFLIELAMNNLLEEACDRVRKILCILDGVECRLVSVQPNLAADQLGDLKVRADAPDALEREYGRWALRLADILGVPLYPYSTRFRNITGGGVGSIPVRG